MIWDPANPEYCDALGTLLHLYADRANSDEIVQLYQRATRLSPHDAQFWADLGTGYDWAGRSNDALDAFEHARRLFPNSPEINWRLANFYVRTGKTPEALLALGIVLQKDSTAGRKVFTLATNATRDGNALLKMLPPQPRIFFDYLNFQIEKGDLAGTEEVWDRVLKLSLPLTCARRSPISMRLFNTLSCVSCQRCGLPWRSDFPRRYNARRPIRIWLQTAASSPPTWAPPNRDSIQIVASVALTSLGPSLARC